MPSIGDLACYRIAYRRPFSTLHVSMNTLSMYADVLGALHYRGKEVGWERNLSREIVTSDNNDCM